MSELLPKGSYPARAIEAAMGRTKGGGEQVAVMFEIADGEYAGRRLTWYGYFTDKTVDRTLESLEHCGWDGGSLANMNGIGNREVSIVVEHEDDQEGKTRARIRWVNSQGGIAMKEKLDPGGLSALESRLKGKMLARAQERKKREQQEDDLNF